MAAVEAVEIGDREHGQGLRRGLGLGDLFRRGDGISRDERRGAKTQNKAQQRSRGHQQPVRPGFLIRRRNRGRSCGNRRRLAKLAHLLLQTRETVVGIRTRQR